MLASVLILGFSVLLLIYWLRYTCLLLLRNVPESTAPVDVSQLSHMPLMNQHQTGLDRLHEALDRDYRIISYVVRHAAGVELNALERHLLTADFRLMGYWFRLTRGSSPMAARKALEEMSTILCFLERRLGRQSA